MPFINCEMNLSLTWSEKCIISSATGTAKFAITGAILYVPVATLSTEHNIKLLKQLESGFKRTINWNKYQSKLIDQEQNKYFYSLIDMSFQGVNSFLSFENTTDRTVHTGYYIPKAEIKDYNVIVDGKDIFEQPIKNDLKTYDNIRKIATGQRDDYWLLAKLHLSRNIKS